MARFRASIQGVGQAARLGDAHTGIRADVSTPAFGVTVLGKAGLDADDVLELYLTRGRASGVPVYLGRITLYNGRPAWEPAPRGNG